MQVTPINLEQANALPDLEAVRKALAAPGCSVRHDSFGEVYRCAECSQAVESHAYLIQWLRQFAEAWVREQEGGAHPNRYLRDLQPLQDPRDHE